MVRFEGGVVNSMYANLEELMQNRVFYNFAEINKIPRCNSHEQKISNYLFKWAKSHDLDAIQDEVLNVIIKKPATFGYKNKPAVIIQAHMDMVCDKVRSSSHNFATDPILLKLEGDKLSSAVGTTLGADNGIGVAMGLALLEADDIPHPPLEVIFTVEEETTMKGALHLDSSNLSGKYLINLDHSVDNEVLAGGCGGIAAKMHIPLVWRKAPMGLNGFSLCINGLTGGHSGEDIHRGRGNANILLARLLYAFNEKFHFWLADLKGGSQRAALPRESEAIILVAKEDIPALQKITSDLYACFKRELQAIEPNLKVTLEPVNTVYEQVFDDNMLNKILSAYLLLPNGIQNMNGTLDQTVESSNNFIVATKENELVFTNEIRGSFASTKYFILDKIKILAKLLDGTVTAFDEYPEWPYNPHSILRELAAKVYREEFGEELKTVVVHAGIEVGALLSKMPYLDAISIGPNCYNFHSPNEYVSISSTCKIWRFLQAILKNIPD